MSPKGNFFPRVVASVICAVPLLCSGAVVFTNDTTINSFDTQYEQADVVVSNCTLTVDGPHAFATLLVGAGATLTHTFSATGFWSITRMITDEAQILSGVNPVTLSNAGTLVTYSVTDTAKSVTYTDTVDYAVSTLTGN